MRVNIARNAAPSARAGWTHAAGRRPGQPNPPGSPRARCGSRSCQAEACAGGERGGVAVVQVPPAAAAPCGAGPAGTSARSPQSAWGCPSRGPPAPRRPKRSPSAPALLDDPPTFPCLATGPGLPRLVPDYPQDAATRQTLSGCPAEGTTMGRQQTRNKSGASSSYRGRPSARGQCRIQLQNAKNCGIIHTMFILQN